MSVGVSLETVTLQLLCSRRDLPISARKATWVGAWVVVARVGGVGATRREAQKKGENNNCEEKKPT